MFVAELGDKTQLATVLFASDDNTNKYAVFAAAASALVVSTAIVIDNVLTLASALQQET